jgi:ribonucleoside-diphosphate reductase alpha chain
MEILPIPAGLWKPNFSENALKVLKQRYFLKDLDGNFVENGQGMLWRVANAVAQAEPAETQEKWIRDFYDIMATMDFMPNSPTLMNAGTDIGMLSACFVVPLEDSMEDIFESLKETALITKSGGGVGIPFRSEFIVKLPLVLLDDNEIAATVEDTASICIDRIKIEFSDIY